MNKQITSEKKTKREQKKDTGTVGPGAQLRSARKNTKISIDDVVNHLKLDRSVIDAIENDDYQHLAAPIYVRGYLKAYCQYLGVKEEPVLSSYKLIVRHDESETVKAAISDEVILKNDKKITGFLIAGILFILIIFGGYWLVETFVLSDDPGAINVSNEIGYSDAPIDNVTEITTDSEMPMNQMKENLSAEYNNADAGTEIKVDNILEPQTDEEIIDNNGSNIKQDKTEAYSDIVIRFSGDSWIKVKEREGVLHLLGTKKTGDEFHIASQSDVEFVIGNSSAVNIEYNGKVFDYSGYVKGNVANFMIKSE